MQPLQMSFVDLKRRALTLVGGSVAFVALVCVGVAFILSASWTDAMRDAEQKLQISTLTLERNIAQKIQSLDVSLQATQNGLAIPELATLAPNLRQAILFDAAVGVAGILGVYVTDEKGDVLYSSRQPFKPVNLASRQYFRTLAASPDLGLFVGPPIQIYFYNSWAVPIARRYNHPDGSFAGVVVGSLALDYFDEMFKDLEISPQSVITLFTNSGEMIARWPHLPEGPGAKANLSPLLGLMSKANNGFFTAESPLDHISRVFAYSRFSDHPLILTSGLPKQGIFSAWYRRSVLLGGIVVALALGGAVLSWRVWRELRRRMFAELNSANAELAAKSALARMDALFAASPDSMLIARVDPDGTYVYEAVNPVWEEMTGVSAADATGQRPEDVMPPPLAAMILAAWQQCFQTRTCAQLAFQSPRADDPREWEALIVPVVSPDGVIRRLISIARDVTERKRSEAALHQTQRLESVGQLTAGLAHNFNNLLQAIYSSTEMLAQSDLDKDGRECVEIATQAARRGSVLVHRLLAFARKQQLQSEVVAVSQIMGDLTLLLTHTLAGRVSVETSVDPSVGWLRIDPGQLEGCLLNLAINARDAMPRGGTLRLRAANAAPEAVEAAGLPEGEYIRFVVEDTGTGMSPETQARAFEPFYTTKGVGQGNGLGLSMVHGFAKQSGGDVQIDSSSTAGTTISLWLPAISAAEVTKTSKPDQVMVELGPKRIMVVDDEEIVCRTLALSLSKAGFKMITALSAEEALELFNSGETCDLMITDQSMPGMSGTELISEVSALHPSLPAILITGYDVLSDMESLPDNVVLFCKPFERDALLSHVRALLGIQSDVAPQDLPQQAPKPVGSNIISFPAGAGG